MKQSTTVSNTFLYSTFVTQHLPWILLLILAIFSRFILLNTTPSYLVRDEMFYQLEAQALVATGQNLLGDWNPWSLTSSNPIYSELSGVVLAPAQALTQLPVLLRAKITHAAMGVGMIFLLGGISYKLFRKKELFYITVVIALVNPWLFQFSRFSFESYFSVFFYTLGIYLFLALPHKLSWLSGVAFFFGFYQYQGLKVVLVPLAFLLVCKVIAETYVVGKSIRNNLPAVLSAAWPAGLILLLALTLTTVFAIRLPQQRAATRQTEVVLFAHERHAAIVNERRRQAIHHPVSTLLSNQYTVLGEDLALGLTAALSPQYWLVSSENTADFWSAPHSGKIYWLDIGFCLITLIALGTKIKKTFKIAVTFLWFWVLAGLLPQILSYPSIWQTFRTGFSIPPLVLLSAFGIYMIWKWCGTRWLVFLTALYVIPVIFFLHTYFYQQPITSISSSPFYTRVASEYISRAQTLGQPISVVTTDKNSFVENITFYQDLIPRGQIESVRLALEEPVANVNGVTLSDQCILKPESTMSGTLLVEGARERCQPETEQMSSISLASVVDSGGMFTLYNDHLCSQFDLPPFLHIQERVFDLSQLSDEEFCKSFFVKYRL